VKKMEEKQGRSKNENGENNMKVLQSLWDSHQGGCDIEAKAKAAKEKKNSKGCRPKRWVGAQKSGLENLLKGRCGGEGLRGSNRERKGQKGSREPRTAGLSEPCGQKFNIKRPPHDIRSTGKRLGG